MAAIILDQLCKSYDHRAYAVDHLDLSINDGEFLVLVGPSGCGKSTALRMIAGLEEISSGDLYIGGRVVNSQSPRQRNIAMVFQSYALYPSKTVYDNIAFPLRMQGGLSKADIHDRVLDVAATLELSDYLGRMPKALSGGQRQRVAMARALVRDPVAFLMDEPLSNLDAKLRVQMRAEILLLQRQTKTTTVYVTHDQVEAMTMGDRVAVLNLGVLQQVAPPQILYRYPVNTFVASFIGSPSMTIFQPSWEEHGDGGIALHLIDRYLPLPDPVLRRWGSAEVIARATHAGLRPEDWSRAPEGKGLWMTIDGVEQLGHEQLLTFTLPPPVGADNTIATVRGQARLDTSELYQPGDQIPLIPDLNKLHLFDAAGNRLPDAELPAETHGDPNDSDSAAKPQPAGTEGIGTKTRRPPQPQ